MSKTNQAFFSIVTVCYQDKSRLANTIASIQIQSCTDFEYIIVDGDSKDGTTELVKEKTDIVDRFISEPDSGIYNAMNKGLHLATGRYILFLNAGDLLIDSQSLMHTRKLLYEAPHAVGLVAPVLVYYPQVKKTKLSPLGSLSGPWRGLPTSHQGIIYNREVLEDFPFDETLKIAADFDQYLRVIAAKNIKFIASTLPLSVIEAGGVSDLKRFSSRLEFIRSITKHVEAPSLFLGVIYQSLMIGYDCIVQPIKKILPPRVLVFIKGLKHHG
jgi:hypothetical protein